MITGKHKWVLVFLVSLLLVQFYGVVGSRASASSNGDNLPPAGSIIVPDDYPTIQEAIDNASVGDTVFVKKGTYNVDGTFYEPSYDYSGIIIDKQISLIGEDSQETIIRGISSSSFSFFDQSVIQVTADNVTIAGLTITSDGHMTGIDVKETNSKAPMRCKIVGNNIVNNLVGINRDGNYNHVTGVVQRSYDVISDNNITGNHDGINIESSDSVISRNFIADNGGNGISVSFSVNVTLSGNTILHNNHIYKSGGSGGLHLKWWGPYYVYGNNLTNNYGFGISIADYCNNATISNNYIANNNIGILSLVPEDYVGLGNKVYENNVINNREQVALNHNGTIAWDNGVRGNYWSDYQSKYPKATELNASGIWNLPYVIDENNTDHFPLMQQAEILTEPNQTPPTKTPPLTPEAEIPLTTIAVVVLILVFAFVVLVLFYRIRRKGVS